MPVLSLGKTLAFFSRDPSGVYPVLRSRISNINFA
jgi:hypothetical protein